MSDHSTLTGIDLHECKGAAAATVNSVRVSDGAGSGTWKKIQTSQIDTTSVFGVNQFVLTVDITDVSTAETVYRLLPCACTLTKVYTVLQAAITVADSIVTIKNDGGATAGTITVATAASAPGDIDSVAPVSNNTFTSGQRISVTTDGGSTTAARLFVTMVFTVTGAIS